MGEPVTQGTHIRVQVNITPVDCRRGSTSTHVYESTSTAEDLRQMLGLFSELQALLGKYETL